MCSAKEISETIIHRVSSAQTGILTHGRLGCPLIGFKVNFVIVLVFVHIYDLSSLYTKNSMVQLERWQVLDVTKHNQYLRPQESGPRC